MTDHAAVEAGYRARVATDHGRAVHRYFQSPREIAAGDAAYLIHDDGWHGQWVPVIVRRVNRVSVTLATRNGTDVRLPHNAARNNVALSFAGTDEDDDHAKIREGMA